jgi:signal transduction histidine kinase
LDGRLAHRRRAAAIALEQQRGISVSLSVRVITASPQVASLVRESLAVSLPSAAFGSSETSDLAPGRLPSDDCIIVDATTDVAGAGDVLRRLRAGGVQSAFVILVTERDQALASRVAGVGAVEQVAIGDAPRQLGAAVESSLGAGPWTLTLEAVRDELRRTQRLLAAGEVALGLQHAMNNPLTAVLAEAQLLEMESLPEEQATAVRRIVENTRRVVQLVRKLDVVSAKEPARPA